MTEKAKDYKPQKYLVLGRIGLEGDKLGWAILPIDADFKLDYLTMNAPVDHPRAAFYTGMRHLRAGTIVSIPTSEDGHTILSKRVEWIENLPEKIATAWQLRDFSIADAHALKKKTAKEGGRDLPFDCLEPWREVISKSFGERRIMLIARLLNYVERGQK